MNMNQLIKNAFDGVKKVKVATLYVVCLLFLGTAGCGEQDGLTTDIDGDPLNDSFLYTDKGEPYDFYYGDGGKKEILYIRKDKVIIKTESADYAKSLCNQSVFLSAYDVGFWVFATINPKITKLEDFWKMSDVINATYGLEQVKEIFQFPTGQLFVECKKGQTPESVLEANGLTESVETIELFDTWAELSIITLNVKLSNALQISRILFESGLCESANPNFMGIGNLLD